MKSRLKAFTLIELLIVVAIIAILAAIAVPNFLEAQTRAKVAKVVSDFRTTSVALESYCVDTSQYVSCTGGGGGYVQPYTARMRRLTTPVAYIAKVPDETPFKAPTVNGNGGNMMYEYMDIVGIGPGFAGDSVQQCCMFMLCAGRPTLPPYSTNPVPWGEGPKYILYDIGPDRTEPWQFMPVYDDAGWLANVVFYDPSNGTVSKGDIYFSPMKKSFAR